MRINSVIHPESPLVNDDYVKIIKEFKTSGKVIDDRGRNLIKSFEVKGVIVNVKLFKVPHFINRVAYKYFRDSKAKRSYDHACLLKANHIGTPQPLAYFEYFTSSGIEQSYYFSEHLSYDFTFRELRSHPEYPDRDKILRQFTRFTFSLHENDIFFKDHSAGNTLIVKNGDNYSFYLIDLNRMDFFKMDLDARMKNFAKLTEDADTVKIMSEEYAKLIGQTPELVFDKMWAEIRHFRGKYERRENLKNKIRGSQK